MSIAIRKPAEIESLRKANRIVAKTLNHLKANIKPGLTLKEVDKMGEDCQRYNQEFEAEPRQKDGHVLGGD